MTFSDKLPPHNLGILHREMKLLQLFNTTLENLNECPGFMVFFGHSDQIFRSVVISNPIKMMHYPIIGKNTVVILFPNNNMFSYMKSFMITFIPIGLCNSGMFWGIYHNISRMLFVPSTFPINLSIFSILYVTFTTKICLRALKFIAVRAYTRYSPRFCFTGLTQSRIRYACFPTNRTNTFEFIIVFPFPLLNRLAFFAQIISGKIALKEFPTSYTFKGCSNTFSSHNKISLYNIIAES